MEISTCSVQVNDEGKQLERHGSVLFPVACYEDHFPEDVVPWHWHEELELIVIIEGSLLVKTSSQEVVLKQGDGFFVNSSVLHTVYSLGKEKCILHSICFHPRFVGGNLDGIIWQKYIQAILDNQRLPEIYFSREKNWNRQMTDGIENAWQCAVEGERGYELKVRNLLSELTWMIYDHCGTLEQPISDKELRNANRAKEMLEYIQRNYMEEITVQKIAEIARISESECLRCFKTVLGVSPIKYVKEFRVHKAAELIRTTDMKMIEIGFACGFQDMSYFAKAFREIEGCTPTKYREKMQGTW